MNKKSVSVTCAKAFLLLFCALCLVCCLGFSRRLIISLMEAAIGRSLNDLTKWNAVIVGSMRFFAFMAAAAYFFSFAGKGRECSRAVARKCAEVASSKDARARVALIFAVLLVSYLALLMAGFDFQDDTKRIISGHKSWVGASRYVSETLAVFLHTNFYINDIAPLTQIAALAVLSLASFALAFALTGGAVTRTAAVASALVGLCPHFVQNMSFKFDSPYMALSVLFAVVPFLFADDAPTFCATSFVCLVLVCSSYQAANSVYLVLAIFLVFKRLNESGNARGAARLALASALCYALTLAFFKAFIMIPTEATIDERNTNVAGRMILSVVRANWLGYMRTVLKGFGNLWIKCLSLMAALLFLRSGAERSARGRLFGLLASALSLALTLSVSYGAYLAIGNAVLAPRAFMGFDALLAAVAVFVARPVPRRGVAAALSRACVLALAWGCCVNATVTGNVFAKQRRYNDFRLSILLGDLGKFVNKGEKSECLVSGVVGPPASTNRDWRNYGINMGSDGGGWMSYILQEWNMDVEYVSIESNTRLLERNGALREKVGALPLLLDNYYHAIYGKDNFFFVELKNPQVERYEIK